MIARSTGSSRASAGVARFFTIDGTQYGLASADHVQSRRATHRARSRHGTRLARRGDRRRGRSPRAAGRGGRRSSGPTHSTPAALEAALPTASNAKWVQLPFAGIENFVHLIDDEHVWTCGKGVYAEPVAELALGARRSADCAASASTRGSTEWTRPIGRNLLGGAGQHPRRWRDRRVARPPAATVRLPHHGRAPERARHGRRRRRARGRPVPGCARGCRPGGAGAVADTRDRGDHRPRRVQADGGARLVGQRRAWAAHRDR